MILNIIRNRETSLSQKFSLRKNSSQVILSSPTSFRGAPCIHLSRTEGGKERRLEKREEEGDGVEEGGGGAAR